MSQQSVSGLLQYEKTFVILRNSSSTVSKSGPAWVQFQLSLYKCRQSSCSQPQPIVQQHRRLTKLLFLSPFILGGMFTDFVPSGASVFPPSRCTVLTAGTENGGVPSSIRCEPLGPGYGSASGPDPPRIRAARGAGLPFP